MNVNCPSCGAENTGVEPGQQVVCNSCFHLFDAKAGPTATPAASAPTAEPVQPATAPEPVAPDPFLAFEDPAPVVDPQPVSQAPPAAGPAPLSQPAAGPADAESAARVNEDGHLKSGFDRNRTGRRGRGSRAANHSSDAVFTGGQRPSRKTSEVRGRPQKSLTETAPRPAPRPAASRPPSQTMRQPIRTAPSTQVDPMPAETEPIAASTNDPFDTPRFDSSASAAPSNPFGDDSFGADNPFSENASASSAASDTQSTEADNPFGGSDWNPFDADDSSTKEAAAPSLDIDEANPFADDDPFATTEGKAMVDELSLDLADTDASQSELTLDYNREEGEALEVGGETPFDLDLPDPTEGMEGGTARRKRRPARSRRGKGKRARQKKRRERILMVALVVLLGGAGMSLTDLGPFGINAITGESPARSTNTTENQQTKKQKKKATGATVKNVHADAALDHLDRIGQLKKQWQKNRKDKTVKRQMATALLKLKERYPKVYANHLKLILPLANVALKPKIIGTDPILDIYSLMTQGKLSEAEKKLNARVNNEEHEVTGQEKYLLGRILRLKNVKATRSKVRKYYKDALDMLPTMEAATYDMATLSMEIGDFANARRLFQLLNGANSNHAGALLGLAILANKRGDNAAAVWLKQSLERATRVKDTDRQFEIYREQALLAQKKKDGNKQRFALKSAFDIRPSDEKITRAYAKSLAQSGQDEEALKAMKACRKNAGCKSASFAYELIQRLIKAGHATAAKTELTASLKLHGNSIPLLMIRAKDELPKQAIQTYRRIIEIKKQYAPAWQRLAMLEKGNGRLREAAKIFEQGVRAVHEKDRLALMKQAAYFHVKTGNTLAAKSFLERIVKHDGKASKFKLELAKTLQELGFLDDSLKLYQQIETQSQLILPNSPEERAYAFALYRKGRLKEASNKIDCGNKRLKDVGEKNPKVEVLCGAIATAEKNYDKATKHLNKALKRKRSADAYYYLGRNALAQKKTKEAVNFFSEAITQDTKNVRSRLALADALRKLGTTEGRARALQHLTKIIDGYDSPHRSLAAPPKQPQAYLARGELFLDHGKHGKALADFNSGLELNPKNNDLRVAKATALYYGQKISAAFNLLKTILKDDRKHAGAHFYLAKMLLAQSQPKKAVSHFKRCLEHSRKKPYDKAYKARWHLGYLYKELKNSSSACQYFRGYLKDAPDQVTDRVEILEEVTKGCK
jgi:tetratricopeptide (TPR) repeat protein